MSLAQQQLDKTFFALSDSTRRGILAQLSSGSARVGDLARPYKMSAPAISKHMRILEDAGLIKRHKSGRELICTLSTSQLKTAEDWINFQRDFWESRLDALDDFLQIPKINT